MSYEFKKLSDTEVVSTVGDSASILIEENGVIKRAPKDEVGGGIKVTSTAKVGQTIVVKAVDENGNPTKWECADKGSQADWNENDETSMAYIQNKPFGDEIKDTILWDEKKVLCTTSGDYAYGQYDGAPDITWDIPVIAVFDEIEYEDISWHESGDNEWILFNTSNGEAVRFYTWGNNPGRISVPASLAGEHTVKIIQKVSHLKQLDSKFIPYILNSSTAGSTKRFRITVDDSGILSAVEVTE